MTVAQGFYRGGVWLLALLALPWLSSPLMADGSAAAAPKPRPFTVHDTDGDGYLSRQEYRVFYDKLLVGHRQTGRPGHRVLAIMHFEEIDSDADGRVSLDEMLVALERRRQGGGWRWRGPAP